MKENIIESLDERVKYDQNKFQKIVDACDDIAQAQKELTKIGYDLKLTAEWSKIG